MINLREQDLDKNQPISNTSAQINPSGSRPAAESATGAKVKPDLSRKGEITYTTTEAPPSQPLAEGRCSPLVIDGKVYVGMGEGENSDLYAFVYCLNAVTGEVIWIYCTCQYEEGVPNQPNVLPRPAIPGGTPPAPFVATDRDPIVRGCSPWSAIAYDAELDRIYVNTGNPQPENTDDYGPPALPAKGYAYSILSLEAKTGHYVSHYQINKDSSYRVSDIDIDFGAAPMIFDLNGRKAVAAGCKNGGFFVVDADTLEEICYRQLLPYYNDGSQIPTVDPHGPDDPSVPDVRLTNQQSNAHKGENFYGTYSTPAIHPNLKRLYIGVGGNNYHFIAPGIDYETTPFMRVMDFDLNDAWEMDESDPRKYIKPSPPMYTTAGEAGLSTPAVVNDVVFCSTSKVAIYAFNAADGTLLWQDQLGMHTQGFKGGYGYCLGMAATGDYVVAGGLIFGRDGGILRIYGFKDT